MTSSGSSTPPPGKPGTPPPPVLPPVDDKVRRSSRRRKSMLWKILEFLDFPMLVAWIYSFLDLFSSKGTEVIRRRRRKKRLALLSVLLVISGGIGAVIFRQRVLRPPLPDFASVIEAAEEAQSKQRYEEAMAHWQELAALRTRFGKAELVENRYQMALCYAALGQTSEAKGMMKLLANGKPAHVGACLWLADELLAKVNDPAYSFSVPKDLQKEAALRLEARNEAKDYLAAAYEADSKQLESLRKLAQMRLKDGEVRAGINDFERLAESNVQDRLTLSILYAATQQTESVARPARSALAELSVEIDRHPQDVRVRLQAAQAALLLRDFESAERLIQDGLRQAGDEEGDEKLRLALGSVFSEWAIEMARQGEWKKAVAKLVTSLHYAPEHGPTFDRLAALAQRPESQDEARSALLAALTQHDQMQGAVYGLLARLAERQGRRREARLLWQMSADSSPASVVPLNELALLAMSDSPPDLSGALALVNKALALDPKPAQLRSTRGRILGQMGRFDESLRDLKAAHDVDSKDPVVLAALYDAYMAKDMPEEAQAHFMEAVASMPRLWVSRVRLAVLERERAKNEQDRTLAAAKAERLANEATEFYNQLLEKNPRDAQLLVLAAEILVMVRNFEGAVKLLEPAINLAGQEVTIRRALSHVYFQWAISERTPAKDASVDHLARLEKSLVYDRDHPQAIQDLLQIARGGGPQAAAASGKVEILLSQTPPSAIASFVAGTNAWSAGEKAEARRLLSQAYEVDPTLLDAANNLAWALMHSEPEDLPQAMKLVSAALREAPDHPNYRGTRGHVLARQKRWAEAKADLEYALKFREDPDNRRLLNQAIKELGENSPDAKGPKAE